MKLEVSRRSFLKLLSLAPLAPSLGASERTDHNAVRTQQDQQKPNILVLLLDALSARNMSLYSYPRDTTPNLIRFADGATVYHAHRAAGNFTTPGTASILTSTYPWTHRAINLAGIIAKDLEHRNLFRLLGPTYHRTAYPQNPWTELLLNQFDQDIDVCLSAKAFSLADGMIHGRGFSNDSDVAFRAFEDLLVRQVGMPGSLFGSFLDKLSVLLVEKVGLSEYMNSHPRGVPMLDQYRIYFLLEDLIDGIMTVLSNARQPYFAFFHVYPPHEPYRPQRRFLGIFDDDWVPVAKEPHFLSPRLPQEALNQRRMEYDEYIANLDAEFRRLHDLMDSAGILDNSYVVVTSDHGELFERGVHAHNTELLHEPVIHIPLLISRPGQQQREDVHAPTSCVDLLPTLLHAIGQPIPDWCEGEVLPALGGEHNSDERSIYSLEAKRNPAFQPLRIGTLALIRGQYKLIHYFGYDGYEDEYELYDLANDPEEMENLYTTRRSLGAELRSELQEKLAEVNQPYSR